MSYEIVHLAVGLPETFVYEGTKEINTAIRKKEVDKVVLHKSGFKGDGVADLKHHGGLDRAVCFYPFEHYEKWNIQFDANLPLAAFGENLLVKGMEEAEVCIGDVFQIGEAKVAITQGRVPCITIDQRTGVKGLFKETMKTGYTGYFAKVLDEGVIQHDSTIQLLKRAGSQISVLEANQLFFQQKKDKSQLEKLLNEPYLAEKWYTHFQRLQKRSI